MPSQSILGSTTGLNQISNSNQFASPFVDLASQYAPQTITSALYLCEFLYLNNSTYRKASERIVNYFLTSVKLEGQSDAQRKQFLSVLTDSMDIIGELQSVGNDFMCYGNSFVSVFIPFTRMLRCAETGCEVKMEKTDFSFDPSSLSFQAYSQKAGKRTKHFVKNYFRPDPSKIKLIRWDPKKISIEHNQITQESIYWYDIPNEERNKVLSGDRFTLETMPWEFIVACCNKKKFRFNKDFIYHFKESSIAGVNLQGWGVPTILSAFKNFFRIQVMQRYDEVLMMDYIVPIRILSPAQGQYTDGNTVWNNSMGRWIGEMASAVTRHRVDGADWNFFPFPVNYQALGGEARALSPKESIEYEEDRLLNARGVPPELYKANMNIQAAPISLRLFERNHSLLVSGFNRLLDWVAQRVARQMKAGSYKASLESVTIVDNIERSQWYLQAMASEIVSKSTAMTPLGLDPKEEMKKIIEEKKDEERTQREAQQELELENIGIGDASAGQGGGSENGGSGNAPTPMDLQSQADQMARQLLVADPTTVRQQLYSLRTTNDTLHALVTKKLEQLRQMARTQGQGMAAQQVASSMPIPGAGVGDQPLQ